MTIDRLLALLPIAIGLSLPGCSAEPAPPSAEDADAAPDVDHDGDEDATDPPDVGPDTIDSDVPAAPLPEGCLTVLEAPADLASLASEAGDVKYLARSGGALPPPPLVDACYFQDMVLYPYHFDLLRAFPGLADLTYDAYVAMVLRRASRVFWAGSMHAWPNTPHPRTPGAGVVSYTVYSDPAPGQGLTVDDVVSADVALAACAPYAADLLVFVPTDQQQRQLVHLAAETLAARGVDVLLPEQLEAFDADAF